MIKTVNIYNGFFGKISYYNKILYKCEFKIQLFSAFYDKRNASLNHGLNDTVLSLDNVYVVYLMEQNGRGLKYHSYGHMMEYHHRRKITSKLQCKFQ